MPHPLTLSACPRSAFCLPQGPLPKCSLSWASLPASPSASKVFVSLLCLPNPPVPTWPNSTGIWRAPPASASSPSLTSLSLPCGKRKEKAQQVWGGPPRGEGGSYLPRAPPTRLSPSLQNPSRCLKSYSILTVGKPLWTHQPSHSMQILLLAGATFSSSHI